MSFAEQLQNGSGINFKETTFDGITYICPTWEEMGQLNFDLAKKIYSTNQSVPPFDRIVALARGGWTWARALADSLDIPELSTFRIKSYNGVNEQGGLKISQPLPDSVDDQNVLVFDEVVDSGLSIKKAKQLLTIMGAKDIKIAALCTKPRSELQPDYYAFSTSAWVVFPHERREFVVASAKRWLERGCTMEEIGERLNTIGLPEEQTEFYLKLFIKSSS